MKESMLVRNLAKNKNITVKHNKWMQIFRSEHKGINACQKKAKEKVTFIEKRAQTTTSYQNYLNKFTVENLSSPKELEVNL